MSDRERTSDQPKTGLRLRVFLPTETLVDEPVRKVIAEADDGSFCLLPRHVDFAAALVPGILIFETDDGAERFLAVDVGCLVKVGDVVQVSAFNAAAGDDLGELKQTVEQSFLALESHEREARSALARLEAGTLRGFAETEEARR